jgi:hypothetical protein
MTEAVEHAVPSTLRVGVFVVQTVTVEQALHVRLLHALGVNVEALYVKVVVLQALMLLHGEAEYEAEGVEDTLCTTD